MTLLSKDTKATTGNTGLAIRDRDVAVLQGNEFMRPDLCGIGVNIDAETGKAMIIPKAVLREAAETFDRMNQGFGWWVGDTGLLVREQYGDEELADWVSTIKGMNLTRAKQLMSISRSYGFPAHWREMREPRLSWQHHNIAQGCGTKTDRSQRTAYLKKAADNAWTTDEFSRFIKATKEGEGKTPKPAAEFPVFKVAHRVWDPKTDNKEQFLAEANQRTAVEFEYYVDPVKRAAREEELTRKELTDKLPEEAGIRAAVIAEGKDLDLVAFTKLVESRKAQVDEFKKMVTHVNKEFKDNAEKKIDQSAVRAELLKKATEKDAAGNVMNLDQFKNLVKEKKQEIRKLKSDVSSIEGLASKIEDEPTRTALLERVAAESLTFEQFKPLVEAALQVQIAAQETAKINETAAKKAANIVSPPEKKAAKRATGGANDPNLSLSKAATGGTKKAAETASKKGATKKKV